MAWEGIDPLSRQKRGPPTAEIVSIQKKEKEKRDEWPVEVSGVSKTDFPDTGTSQKSMGSKGQRQKMVLGKRSGGKSNKGTYTKTTP